MLKTLLAKDNSSKKKKSEKDVVEKMYLQSHKKRMRYKYQIQEEK